MKKIFGIVLIVMLAQVGKAQYEGNVDLSFHSGSEGSVKFTFFGITTTHGIKTNGFFIGMGTGIEKITAKATVLGTEISDDTFIIPLYLQPKYTFDIEKIKPFISANIGLMYDTEYYLSDGISFYPELNAGLSFAASEDINIDFGVSYRIYSEVNYFGLKGGISF